MSGEPPTLEQLIDAGAAALGRKLRWHLGRAVDAAAREAARTYREMRQNVRDSLDGK